jgi:acyl-CoA synthetase (NDP forming)
MLEARSVAVVGASVKPRTLGAQMLEELRRGGFSGSVYPVNPSYEEVAGLRCYPSILEVPEPVDLAILGVANRRIEAAMRDAAEAGAAGVVTFSSLHEDPQERPDPDAPPLRERIAHIARAHGMALCGGNGMGFLNVPHGLRATGFPTPDDLRAGPVTLISHSGSAFAAFAFSDRGIGFDLLVSSGQELVTTMADYLAFALHRPTTRVVGLLLETVRDPEGLRAQLAAAAERDVPIVALPVGRTEGSKAMVTAHSGALAGEHGALEALFDAYGVHEVRTMEELADALELLSSPRRIAGGRGLASVHDSGGERALFVDLAADADVPFAPVSPATLAAIDAVLDPGLEAANPLDAWGTGIDADRIFREAMLALEADEATSALAFVVDLTRQGEPYDEGYLGVARAVWDATTKPFCVVSNLPSAIAPEEARLLRDHGIPVLEGTASGLRALRLLLDRHAFARRPAARPSEPVPDEVRARWRERLAAPEPLAEVEGLALLADYGIPTVAARAARTLEEVVEAAEAIGYPVAIKTAAPGVAHKSDVGGVILQRPNADAVREAYAEIADRLGPYVTVEAMAPPGVEMALGIVRDPSFGPLVLVAAGGVLVELLHDRAMGLPPLDEAAGRRLVERLATRRLLDGFRGRPAADVGALARALERLSVLAVDLGDLIAALDVNPIVVWEGGCVAADVLVEPLRPAW